MEKIEKTEEKVVKKSKYDDPILESTDEDKQWYYILNVYNVYR